MPSGELGVYVSRWKVLLGDSNGALEALDQGLRRLGSVVEKRNHIGSVLAGLQGFKDLDAVVLSKAILGRESDNLLKVIAALAPQVGIVVLCGEPERERSELRSLAVFEGLESSMAEIIRAMVESKTLARSREASNPESINVSALSGV